MAKMQYKYYSNRFSFFSVLLFITCLFSLSAQNYRRYYEMIDSANLYQQTKETALADSFYIKAFQKYEGFADDFIQAAINIHDKDKRKMLMYLDMAAYYGAHEKNLRAGLKKSNILISKKDFNKIHRIPKNRKLAPSRTIWRMLIRDQLARKTGKPTKIIRADSLNLLAIKKMINKDSAALSRLNHNEIVNSIIEILLIHQNFKTIKKDFQLFYSYVEKGKLGRSILTTIIERDAMWGGNSFKVDTLENRLYKAAAPNLKFKNGFLHCTALGTIPYYLKGKMVIVPINPNMSKTEYNSLRHFLFLSDYDLFRKSYESVYIFADIEAFEKYLLKDNTVLQSRTNNEQ